MIEYREITSADGDLVGALEINDGVLKKFRCAKKVEVFYFHYLKQILLV